MGLKREWSASGTAVERESNHGGPAGEADQLEREKRAS